MSDGKFEPFKAGDWQSRQRPAPRQEASEEEIRIERNYPLFKRYLKAGDFGPLFRRCEQSCIELDRMVRTGNREAAEEAQHAINAYGRSMKLAAELLELKAKFSNR
jgi:hypothetical protein